MKLLYLFLLHFMLLQNPLIGQWHGISLELVNGETVTGIGKIKGNIVKFKPDEEAKVQKMNHQQVRKVFIDAYSARQYEKITRQANGRKPLMFYYSFGFVKMPYTTVPRLLPVEYAGKKITVYRKSVEGLPVMSTGTYSSVMRPAYEMYYYVIREGEQHATVFQPSLSRTNFNSNVSYKSLKEYFADCEHLLKMLEDKSIKKDLLSVVKRYEKECD